MSARESPRFVILQRLPPIDQAMSRTEAGRCPLADVRAVCARRQTEVQIIRTVALSESMYRQWPHGGTPAMLDGRAVLAQGTLCRHGLPVHPLILYH
jgi:hypothetical protein